ncbi:MAG: aminomethyl-transferring glycine dehydrogenase subunit GcvPA [bacterium]
MSYCPHTKHDQDSMIKEAGLSSVSAMFSDIPKEIINKSSFALPAPLSEIELGKELSAAANKNISVGSRASFMGGGSYHHFIPAAVKHLAGRSEFYTAYTPYQAEMSQGMLQAIFEYQSYICRLTGMDVANASLYDGATALAEAAALAVRSTGKSRVLFYGPVNPNYLAVLKTYAKAASWIVEELKDGDSDFACILCQQPNFFGCIEDLSKVSDIAHKNNALFIVSVDPISLGILKPPSEYGADIVVGEGQSLGSPPSFGGPGLGFFAATKKYMRLVPGRLVGETTDSDGKRGYVLTLQAREQHIRREKAYSNICTNSALMALAATIYLSLMGKSGLKKVAELCLQKSHYLKEKISSIKGFSSPLLVARYSLPAFTFKEFVIKSEKPIKDINNALLKEGFIGGIDLEQFCPELKNHMLLCVTELITKEDMDKVSLVLSEA